MFQDEKKKKESLSWIDEILSGEEDPLAGILKKDDKKEQPSKNKVSEELPVPSSGVGSLEDILSGSTSEKRESRPTSETGADLLSQLLGGEEKPQKSMKEKLQREKKESRYPRASQNQHPQYRPPLGPLELISSRSSLVVPLDRPHHSQFKLHRASLCPTPGRFSQSH